MIAGLKRQHRKLLICLPDPPAAAGHFRRLAGMAWAAVATTSPSAAFSARPTYAENVTPFFNLHSLGHETRISESTIIRMSSSRKYNRLCRLRARCCHGIPT
jgi:hypothetical protein